MGLKVKKKRSHLLLMEFIRIVRKYGIKSGSQYGELRKQGKLPDGMPSEPEIYYSKGYIDREKMREGKR